MVYDMSAQERHFLEHMVPVWNELPNSLRGTVWVEKSLIRYARKQGVPAQPQENRPRQHRNPTICASWGDLRRIRRNGSPVVMMEHGAGQRYVDSKSNSYVGAPDRDGVGLVFVPNQQAFDAQVAAHPDIPTFVVGCPKLDGMVSLPKPDVDVVAVSHHWDGVNVSPECRSAYDHFKNKYTVFNKAFETIGHCHPKSFAQMQAKMARHGFVMTPHFRDVIAKSTVYVTDNSSTLFEYAALDRPVVVLNAPWYRRDVNHGGRFWDWADIGLQVDSPDDLISTVQKAIEDPPEVAERRRELVKQIYPHIGGSSRLVANVLVEHHNRLANMTASVNTRLRVPRPTRT